MSIRQVKRNFVNQNAEKKIEAKITEYFKWQNIGNIEMPERKVREKKRE
jgi:hypothetical protein